MEVIKNFNSPASQGFLFGGDMSRTRRGSKPLGYDYWSKRPYSKCGFGKFVKNMTKRVERAQEHKIIENELKDVLEDEIDTVD